MKLRRLICWLIGHGWEVRFNEDTVQVRCWYCNKPGSVWTP